MFKKCLWNYRIVQRNNFNSDQHPAVSFQAHRLFCVRAESKFGRDANLNTMNSYVDLLIEEADGRC